MNARPRDEAAVDGIAHYGINEVRTPRLAHGREAGVEGFLGIDGGIDRAVRRRLFEDGKVATVVIDGREVRMGVDEAGEQGVAGQLQARCPSGHPHAAGRSHVENALSAHDHHGIGDLGAVTNDDAVGVDGGDAGRRSGLRGGRGRRGRAEQDAGREGGAEESKRRSHAKNLSRGAAPRGAWRGTTGPWCSRPSRCRR